MKDTLKKYRFLIIYIIGILGLVLIDQVTKVAAETALYGKNAFVIIEGVFEFSYLRNEGAAWGMLQGQRYFFLAITVVLVGVVSYVVCRMPSTKRMVPMEIFCILVTAGAIGNFIDRLLFGYVRDFIYVSLIDFPVFNVADMYVTIAEGLFVILIFFIYKEGEFDFLKFNHKKKKQV